MDVICPNCYGRTCKHCEEYGPFGLVPEGADVEITLKTGMTAEVPASVRMRKAMGAWLLGDGGVEALDRSLADAATDVRKKWDNDDEDDG